MMPVCLPERGRRRSHRRASDARTRRPLSPVEGPAGRSTAATGSITRWPSGTSGPDAIFNGNAAPRPFGPQKPAALRRGSGAGAPKARRMLKAQFERFAEHGTDWPVDASALCNHPAGRGPNGLQDRFYRAWRGAPSRACGATVAAAGVVAGGRPRAAGELGRAVSAMACLDRPAGERGPGLALAAVARHSGIVGGAAIIRRSAIAGIAGEDACSRLVREAAVFIRHPVASTDG
jgi:hypothetical protein